MAELRWNPMIRDWVIIAPKRQARPDENKDSNKNAGTEKKPCPFCPGVRNNLPDEYDVLRHDNDFPALSLSNGEETVAKDIMTASAADIYKTAPAYGKCEVILYSSEHDSKLSLLSADHMIKLVELWTERYRSLSSDEKIKYVFIFENRGDKVGVTISHPHGQIYAYSKLPKKIETELESCRQFYAENGKCLFCRINEEERAFGHRVIYKNGSFVAYVPFFADYAYGVYISSLSHKLSIADFTSPEEKADLADIIQTVSGAYDALYDIPFPYMMCMHNAPRNVGGQYEGLESYYHFHVEFYPPLRTKDQQQYQASSETGVWAHGNPTNPEDKAAELAEAVLKYKNTR